MSYRPKRVSDEIRKVISERLIRGLRDPLPGFVTVRDVEVNRDFSRAKVFVSVFGTEEEKRGAIEVLQEQRKVLRQELGRKIRLRNTPELIFVLDETGDRAARIHKLLQENQADYDAREQSGVEVREDEGES